MTERKGEMELKEKLVELLLEYVEQNATGGFLPTPEFEGYSERQVDYHLDMIHQAGYITGQRMMMGIRPQCLTWEGQMALRKFRGKPRL